MTPILESEPSGIFFIAESKDATIKSERGIKTLEINLRPDARVANHVVPAFRGKEGIVLVQDLFGKKENIEWGEDQKKKIEQLDKEKRDYSVLIASPEHPVRWTSGRGLVIVDGYALLNIRALSAPTDPGKMSDMGGHGEKEDIFNPGYGAHREIAEEVAILGPEKELLVPEMNREMDRGVDFEAIIRKACKDTGLEYHGLQKLPARERKDLAENSRVKVYRDGDLKLDEELQFFYEPSSNCGIDVMTIVEYNTLDLNVPDDILLGFAEYYGSPGKYVVLGKDNDLALVRIEDLLDEFDRGKKAVPVEAHVKNAYTRLDEKRKVDATFINGSLREQLKNMKNKIYRFGE